jgi:hypothetical protein
MPALINSAMEAQDEADLVVTETTPSSWVHVNINIDINIKIFKFTHEYEQT